MTVKMSPTNVRTAAGGSHIQVVCLVLVPSGGRVRSTHGLRWGNDERKERFVASALKHAGTVVQRSDMIRSVTKEEDIAK